jgi:hypothetical protein
MEDTLKTAAIGVGGSLFGWLEIAGPVISAFGALATLIYMIIKIYKEVK